MIMELNLYISPRIQYSEILSLKEPLLQLWQTEVLKWETTTMTNIGLDMDIFNSRLNFVADLFYKKTDDILIKLPVPLVLGGLAAPNQNAGIVSNRGVEISFNWA